MREIKFRAWDKNDKVMRSWVDVILEKDNGDDYYLLGYKENKVVTSYDHDQILMQYTGLKDEDGREIYEGDILDVEFERHPFAGSWKGVVKFIDGSYIVENLEGTDGDYLFDESREVEVIGNVHQNPELLEVRK